MCSVESQKQNDMLCGCDNGFVQKSLSQLFANIDRLNVYLVKILLYIFKNYCLWDE